MGGSNGAGNRGQSVSIEEMQAKCNALQQKLFETRNKNVELQNQLKLAQKCLQLEIGDNFNLNILASQTSGSNWRGRAQQILTLQQKVQELKEKLELYEQRGGSSNAMYHEGIGDKGELCDMGVASSVVSGYSAASFDRPSIRRNEILHRAKVEGLEKEINNLKAQIEDQRSKILALKVRNKTLNDDILRYKMKASSLEEQSDCNSLNMATINDRIQENKSKYERRIEALSSELETLTKLREEDIVKGELLEKKFVEHEEMLFSKDAIIDELNATNKKLEDDLKAICGDFLFSCRELRKVGTLFIIL